MIALDRKNVKHDKGAVKGQPVKPDELATLIPEQFQSKIRKGNPLSKSQMEEFGMLLEIIDDPRTKPDAIRRHLRAIHEGRLFLAVSETYRGFIDGCLKWTEEKFNTHLLYEYPQELVNPDPTSSTSAKPTPETGAPLIPSAGGVPIQKSHQDKKPKPEKAFTGDGPTEDAEEAVQDRSSVQAESSKIGTPRRISAGTKAAKTADPSDENPADAPSDGGGSKPTETWEIAETAQMQRATEASTLPAGTNRPPASADDAPSSHSPTTGGDSPVGEVREIPLHLLRRPEELRVRAKTDNKTVREYTKLKREGVDLGHISVFDIDGDLVIADGNHRYEAAEAAGQETISCIVHLGTHKDALQFALAANAKRGLRLTNADKRRCAEIAITQFDDWSDRRIAEVAGVSYVFVGKVRKQLVTVTSSSGKIGKDGKHRKPKVRPEAHQTQDEATTSSRNETPDGEERTDDERPAVDPDDAEESSSDGGANEGGVEPVKHAPPFDRKANWLPIKQHLLSKLPDWPEEHRSYLGDQLCAFANKHCPEDQGPGDVTGIKTNEKSS